MQETEEYKMEKDNLVNSDEVKKISGYKFVSKNVFASNKSFDSKKCMFMCNVMNRESNLFASYNTFDSSWSIVNRTRR